MLRFSRSLCSIPNAPHHAKYISLNDQQCINQPTIINLGCNEYIERLRCFPFADNLDRCIRNNNTLNDLSNKVFVLNKTEDLHLSVFSMITGINESEILTNHI